MLGRVLWENRANLDHAWRLLRRGACDACCLGSNGLQDWSVGGLHRCLARASELWRWTLPPLDLRRLPPAAELAQRSEEELARLGRVPYPLLRRAGEPGFRRVAWEEALDLAAERLRATEPSRVALRVDPRGLSNEALYVAQKVARAWGTPHVSSVAGVASLAPLREALGVDAPSVPCSQWGQAELLVLFGAHFAEQLPAAERVAAAAEARGVTVLRVGRDPERSPVAGGELAFLRATQRTLVDKHAVQRAYVDRHTWGYAELEAELKAADLDALVEQAGVTRSQVFEFAAALCRAEHAVFAWPVGPESDPRLAQERCNLALLRGLLGPLGSGLAPLAATPGARAAWDLGLDPQRLPGGPLDAARARELSAAWGFDVPARPGYADEGLLAAAADGALDGLYGVGREPFAAVAAALPQVGWAVHQATTLSPAALAEPRELTLILPMSYRSEERGVTTSTASDRRVSAVGHVPGRAPREARCGWEALVELTRRACPERALGCADVQAIREELAQFVLAYRGIEALRAGDSLVAREAPTPPGMFATEDGRARLLVD